MKIRIYVAFAVLLISACRQEPVNENDDLITKNQAIARQYFEKVWNKGELSQLDTLLSKNYINHTPSAPTKAGPEGLKPIVAAIRKAFPDLHYEIKQIIATKDMVMMRVVMTGTHLDTLFGLPPTGKKISVLQMNFEKIENGRISEHWRVTDELTMMKQLGIVK